MAGCSLFRALDHDVCQRMISYAHRRCFAAGDIIFHMGSEGRSMMAVLTGVVRIAVPSPQGRQVVLADLGPGEVFGEMALFDGGGRSADAIALTNCALTVLERRDMLFFLEQYPQACLTLLELLSRRLRAADEQMADFQFLDSHVRLAKLLLRKAAALGRNGIAAKIALSQRELGTMAGVRRERVNRCLQEWQRSGIVQLKRGWILIQDLEKLRQVAECD